MKTNMQNIRGALTDADFMGYYSGAGIYAIVDGQFGSTGKGLLAATIAEALGSTGNGPITSNAGPNSGHTFYYQGSKVVLRQLPSAAVWNAMSGVTTIVYLNAGAVIVPELLVQEIREHSHGCLKVIIDPAAAVVTEDAVHMERELIGSVGSTGKGTGAALAMKIMRKKGSTIGDLVFNWPDNVAIQRLDLNQACLVSDKQVLMEVSQGYSLSMNASGFYPQVTSRDCTVGAAMADAGAHPTLYKGCAMVVRTFPIRVAGNSGPGYHDQRELTWDEVGQTPELTTVTGKQRRVFSWSKRQYEMALEANRPSVVMANFMNYLPEGTDHDAWVNSHIVQPHEQAVGGHLTVLLGYGPENHEVVVYQ